MVAIVLVAMGVKLVSYTIFTQIEDKYILTTEEALKLLRVGIIV